MVKSDIVGGLFCWDEHLSKHRNDGAATLEAFTSWLWSGNGFSKARDTLSVAYGHVLLMTTHAYSCLLMPTHSHSCLRMTTLDYS